MCLVITDVLYLSDFLSQTKKKITLLYWFYTDICYFAQAMTYALHFEVLKVGVNQKYLSELTSSCHGNEMDLDQIALAVTE